MNNNLKGSIILLITALIWGTAFVAQSSAMDNIGPLLFMVVRFFLGGLVLVPVIIINGRTEHAGHPSGSGAYKGDKSEAISMSVKAGIACGIGLAIGSGFQQFGIITTSAGKAGFLTALYIILVPLAGIFIGKKPPKSIWISVVSAIAGFYLLSINLSEGLRIETGDILLTICALGFTLQIMLIDHFMEKGADPFIVSSTQFFTVSAIFFFPMLIWEGLDTNLIADAAFSIFYTGVMSSGVAYTLQMIGQKYTEPALASLIMSLESVFAAVFGWLLLNEALTPREIAGCVLVFAAVIIAQLAPVKKAS